MNHIIPILLPEVTEAWDDEDTMAPIGEKPVLRVNGRVILLAGLCWVPLLAIWVLWS